MLAEHGLVHDLNIVNPFLIGLLLIHNEVVGQAPLGWVTTVVAVNTHPVHFTAVCHLILAYYGNVILTLAGNHASATANTSVEVNRHTPLMDLASRFWLRLVGMLVDLLGLPVLVVRDVPGMSLEVHVLGEIRFGLIIFKIGLTHDSPSFHGPVVLSAGNGVGFAHTSKFGPRAEVSSLAAPQGVSVITYRSISQAAHSTRLTTTIA